MVSCVGALHGIHTFFLSLGKSLKFMTLIEINNPEFSAEIKLKCLEIAAKYAHGKDDIIDFAKQLIKVCLTEADIAKNKG